MSLSKLLLFVWSNFARWREFILMNILPVVWVYRVQRNLKMTYFFNLPEQKQVLTLLLSKWASLLVSGRKKTEVIIQWWELLFLLPLSADVSLLEQRCFEIVNHKNGFLQHWGTVGLSRRTGEGSFSQRSLIVSLKDFMQLFCMPFVNFANTHRASVLLGDGNIQINKTYLWPPCMSEDWINSYAIIAPIFRVLIMDHGPDQCFHCLDKSSQLPKRWLTRPYCNSRHWG